MLSDDSELSALAAKREEARRIKAQRKLTLDSCFQNLKSVRARAASQPSIDRLVREGDHLHSKMSEAFGISKACYEMHDHEGAAYWSKQGRALEAKLNEINGEKNSLIAMMVGPAQASFVDARDSYREAKANHEAAMEKFAARRDLLKERSRERAREKANRAAEAKVFQRVGEIEHFKELAIIQAKKELQFEDKDIRVEVKHGYDKNYNQYVTHIYIIHRDKSVKRHLHVIRDFDGRELLSEYHRDRRRDRLKRLLQKRDAD